MPPTIAQVAVGLPVPGPFDYSIPEGLSESIGIGKRVEVPFRSSRVTGYVVGFLDKSEFPTLKPVLKVLDSLSPAFDGRILDLSRELAGYYGCSLGEALETALPVALRRKTVTALQGSVAQRTSAGTIRFCHDQGLINRRDYCLSAIKKTLESGAGVLYLVPEVHLIEDIKNFLHKNGIQDISVLDRGMKPGVERQEWEKVRQGKSRVVIGTRSAVFAPVVNLGLVIMSEEENPAYKQEQPPHYHARETVVMRQEREGFSLIFVGSAPSAELVYFLRKKKIVIDVLPSGGLGDIQVLDMTNYKPRKGMRMSFPLQSAVDAALTQGGKVLLFLNRRGFSSRTSCNACGLVLRCERCDVPLIYLYSKKKLSCHRCGLTQDLPKVCPQCRSSYLRSTGGGVEKLESEISRIYPQARVAVFDRESRRIPVQAQIIVATQAVLRVIDRLDLSLIGVLDFEAELNRMDFRSAQKAFTLLIRLRQSVKGKVVVQTSHPGNYCLTAAQAFAFDRFYDEELKNRSETGLPPHEHLAALGVRGPREETVFDQGKDIFRRLEVLGQRDVEILEPQPDFTPKLRDKYRLTIMLKSKTVERIWKILTPVLAETKKSKGTVCTVNMDP